MGDMNEGMVVRERKMKKTPMMLVIRSKMTYKQYLTLTYTNTHTESAVEFGEEEGIS